MRRTQLYLEDETWNLLHLKAKQTNQTVSELVRQAVREKYGAKPQQREAMEAMIGLRRDREDITDTDAYVRQLRRDDRFKRLHQ